MDKIAKQNEIILIRKECRLMLKMGGRKESDHREALWNEFPEFICSLLKSK